jgi:hypothetical protein
MASRRLLVVVLSFANPTITRTPTNSSLELDYIFSLPITPHLVTRVKSTKMASYRSTPISELREHYVSMRKSNIIN